MDRGRNSAAVHDSPPFLAEIGRLDRTVDPIDPVKSIDQSDQQQFWGRPVAPFRHFAIGVRNPGPGGPFEVRPFAAASHPPESHRTESEGSQWIGPGAAVAVFGDPVSATPSEINIENPELPDSEQRKSEDLQSVGSGAAHNEYSTSAEISVKNPSRMTSTQVTEHGLDS
jgi:hypothetical protein